MSDAVLVAIIASIPGILGVVFAGRANHNAKKARYQVENDHSTNLRVENDERHGETVRFQRNMLGLLNRGLQSLSSMRDDVNYLRSLGHSNRSRIDNLEREKDKNT